MSRKAASILLKLFFVDEVAVSPVGWLGLNDRVRGLRRRKRNIEPTIDNACRIELAKLNDVTCGGVIINEKRLALVALKRVLA